MKKRTIFLLVIIILTILAGVISIYAIERQYYAVKLSPSNMDETTAELHNPYQGWYHIFGYTLSDDSNLSEGLFSTTAQYKQELVQLQFNLQNYQNQPLSAMALEQLDQILDIWQDSGKQLIVRFLYDYNGHAAETEPGDLSTILLHMDQTAVAINKHKDSVYLMQGIFVGNYGEMNNSVHMQEQPMRQLANHLCSIVDPSIFLSVRTPAHWRTINRTFSPLSKKDAYTEIRRSRIGLYNDGMLGSGNDLGTYGDDDLNTATSFSAKGTLEQELEFQHQLCRYVPNGGEVVLDDPRSDFESAIEALARMHVSYLNYEYDKRTLDKWRTSIYTGAGPFAGTNGFTYIGQHLGYRYFISAMTCSFNWKKDKNATLTLKLKNSGFASSYRQFRTVLTLEHEKTGNRTEFPLSFDNRYVSGGTTKKIRQVIPIRSLPLGTYRVYLKMTDPVTGREITLANSFLHSYSKGYCLGTLRLRKLTKQ